MSVIKSASGATTLEATTFTSDGTTDIVVSRGTNEVYGIFDTADLLAALDATANTDVAEWKARAEKAEATVAQGDELANDLASELKAVAAERDMLKAAVDAVRTARDHAWQRSCTAVSIADLDAALDPKPAFTLPTEAGAGIVASRTDGPFKGELQELRLFSDGRWFNSTGHPSTPDQVMGEYTDHRLLGAEQ